MSLHPIPNTPEEHTPKMGGFGTRTLQIDGTFEEDGRGDLAPTEKGRKFSAPTNSIHHLSFIIYNYLIFFALLNATIFIS